MLDNRNSPGTVGGAGAGRGRGGAARQVAGRGGSWAVAVSRSDLSSCLMVSPDLASSSYVNISAHSSLPPERWTPGSQEIIGEVSGSLLQLLRSIHNMGCYLGLLLSSLQEEVSRWCEVSSEDTPRYLDISGEAISDLRTSDGKQDIVRCSAVVGSTAETGQMGSREPCHQLRGVRWAN